MCFPHLIHHLNGKDQKSKQTATPTQSVENCNQNKKYENGLRNTTTNPPSQKTKVKPISIVKSVLSKHLEAVKRQQKENLKKNSNPPNNLTQPNNVTKPRLTH